MKWWWVAAAIAVVVLLAGGAMVWQMGRHSAAQIASAPAPAPGGSKPVTSAAAPFPNASENSAPAIPAALDGAMRSLVLYFNFDSQPVGARVPDLSGHGNEGRAVNVQWVADGHRGGSIRFGKDDSYITVLNNALLNPPRFTLAAWIKTSYSDRVWRRIFDKGTGIDYDLTMGGDVKGNQRFRGWVALEVGKTWAPSQVRVTDGRWHQVVGTFDGEMARTYVDGMPVGRPGHWKGTPTPVMWNLTIGANRSNPDAALGEVGASFNGLMDDVMMFNRALLPREVQALYDSQRTAADRPLARKQPAPDAQAQLKARRISALSGAFRVFQNRDPETANLVSNILASLNQPGGLTTNELAHDDMERMRSRVRELVRRGDMESAAALNHAQIMTFYSYDFPSQPGHPNQKSGGTPGPGGLVLYLPFDKPDTNGVVYDESGTGNDGRVFGAQWVPDGKFGGAYRFSISDFDDRIVIPNSDSLDAEDLTVAAWIKAPADTGFFERILDKDFHHGFALSLSGDWQNQRDRGRLLWETGNGTVTSGRRPDDNQWHHVAATYDGHFVRCYVDGVETANRAIRQGPLNKSGWDLCIGNSVVDYGWGELMAFNGLIDEVRVYNRALSPAEIRNLATATHAGVDVVKAPDEKIPKSDTAGHLENLNKPEDQAWLAWAKRLPISANPLPRIQDRNEGLTLKNFSDYPLFGEHGPSRDDVLQGRCGDCYFMLLLAALADAHPEFIKKIVNDVGDGTYVIHLVRLNDHREFVVRINAELWVDYSGHLENAKIGRNGAIWPALLEKAYAVTRKPPYNYQAAIGGCEDAGTQCFLPVKSLTFGPGATKPYTEEDWNSHEHWIASEPVPAKDVAGWFNDGEPIGPIRDAVDVYSLRQLKWFKMQLDAARPSWWVPSHP